ncbi:CBO0543 family protein [Paenibacillus xanthanilyticus]|uniref:CBO0543 family protein n=1 Tax=Paenibacillus xanthanilyticus TaxID=1783531 RepID=A0ABV8JZJ1_9BACL
MVNLWAKLAAGDSDYYVLLISTFLSLAGTVWVLKTNWKYYGRLYAIAALAGTVICALFVGLGYYEFDALLIPVLKLPVFLLLTLFPFYVLFGVKYSPKPWPWKIPFYWGIVHIGVFFETMLVQFTEIIEFKSKWDIWDSYTWWWIFLLVFEYVGGLCVPEQYRKPLDKQLFHFGKVGWLVLHFILILTIFMAGYYVGKVT